MLFEMKKKDRQNPCRKALHDSVLKTGELGDALKAGNQAMLEMTHTSLAAQADTGGGGTRWKSVSYLQQSTGSASSIVQMVRPGIIRPRSKESSKVQKERTASGMGTNSITAHHIIPRDLLELSFAYLNGLEIDTSGPGEATAYEDAQELIIGESVPFGVESSGSREDIDLGFLDWPSGNLFMGVLTEERANPTASSNDFDTDYYLILKKHEEKEIEDTGHVSDDTKHRLKAYDALKETHSKLMALTQKIDELTGETEDFIPSNDKLREVSTLKAELYAVLRDFYRMTKESDILSYDENDWKKNAKEKKVPQKRDDIESPRPEKLSVQVLFLGDENIHAPIPEEGDEFILRREGEDIRANSGRKREEPRIPVKAYEQTEEEKKAAEGEIDDFFSSFGSF